MYLRALDYIIVPMKRACKYKVVVDRDLVERGVEVALID